MKKLTLVSCLLMTAITTNTQQADFPKLTGPYLGQKPPGELPEAFAPSIMSSKNAVHGHIAITPDGGEIYWIFLPPDYGKNPPAINVIKQVNGHWTKPEIPEFSRRYGAMNISLSPDGKRLYFDSNRPWPDSWGPQPTANGIEAYRTWYVERGGASWGEPKPLDREINQYLRGVSVTNDRTLYTHGIKRSRMIQGQYTEWEQLGHPLDVGGILGGNPHISPDESYILFNKNWPGKVGYGIFISYRTQEDGWTEPVNLLEKLNAPRGGSQPNVTPDGKYLFCYSGGEFFWMDAKIIDDLKPKKLK
jgi:hypothetical protein